MTERSPNPLPPATILGIGAITPLGRDLIEISKQLEPAPAPHSPLLRVNDELLAEPKLARSLRRADRFVRMAAIAAIDAWTRAESACDGIAKERIGLIVTSGLGPHCRGFKFLDDILVSGDSNALPTDFSHSVHGAAASYIAGLLDFRGPSLTTTDFEMGLEQAVLLAQSWLHQKTCDRVLVGCVEELGQTMIEFASRMLKNNGSISLGEGAIFLALGPLNANGIARLNASDAPETTDLLLYDDPPIPSATHSSNIIAAKTSATFTPYFGHTASSSAFQLLGGLLSLSAKRPLGKLLKSAGPNTVDNATTLRTSCAGPATLRITAIRES